MVEDRSTHHRFIVSNDSGVVIRCCVHCGLSHQMERYNRPPHNEQIWEWKLILEEKGDETFTQPCPVENGSDDLFPHHHFILSNHHTHNNASFVIRFCVRCGLSHFLGSVAPSTLNTLRMQGYYPLSMYSNIPCWKHINEDERDLTVSDPCPVEQESDALKQRYVPVPRN